MNQTAKLTLTRMMAYNIIPNDDSFLISERLLDEYIRIYGSITGKAKTFDIALARKLAGINLLEYKTSFDSKNNQKEGIVYIVSNPVWPDKMKVGMTGNLFSRIDAYQTYDPYRSFQLDFYEFVLDRRRAEKLILDEYQISADKGEWISKEHFASIKSFVKHKVLGYEFFSGAEKLKFVPSERKTEVERRLDAQRKAYKYENSVSF